MRRKFPVAKSLALCLCVVPFMGQTCNVDLTFIVPASADSSETTTAPMFNNSALIVNNQSGSTRVVVDPGATEAVISVTKTALAEDQAAADALLAKISVEIESPNGSNPDLVITATRPPEADDSTSDVDFNFDNDEFNVTGIFQAKLVALVRLQITIPPGHAVQVIQGEGPVRTIGLDTTSSLTADHGSIRAIKSNANLSITNNDGDINVEDHEGSLDVDGDIGEQRIELDGLAADGHVSLDNRIGTIHMEIRKDLSADLDAVTQNGIVQFEAADFDAVSDVDQAPRHVTARLNSGGPPIDVINVNGGIRIEGD